MEITYKITEDEYVGAWKLRCGIGNLDRGTKAILCWVYVFFLFFGVSRFLNIKSSSLSNDASIPNIMSNPLGLALLAALVVFLSFGYYAPRRVRSLYRRDPTM